jgi:hypothetical protein
MVINGDIMGSDGNIHYQWRGFFAEKIHYLKFVESVMFGKKTIWEIHESWAKP